MIFDRPFIKLPILFSAEALAAEVRALPPSAWGPHATGFQGNEAVRLVTPGGHPSDLFAGPMRPTEHLAKCQYIRQVMTALGGVWGRSRLMGLGAGGQVPEHVDAHYHWRTHLRIHVPIITTPQVEFTCGGETVHMAAGECWLFDSFRWHEVHNRGSERRIHLVLDTVVTEALWDLIQAARSGEPQLREFHPGENAGGRLMFEQVNAPRVMSPWELRSHLSFLREQAMPSDKLAQVLLRLDRFASAWTALWAQFGTSDQGVPSYRRLLASGRADVAAAGASDVLLRNELALLPVLDQIVFGPALNVPDARAAVADERQLAL